MAKRTKQSEDMQLVTIHQDLKTLKNRVDTMVGLVDDIKTIVGGSAALDFKGIRGDVRDLKTHVLTIDEEIEKIKKIEADRWSLQIKTLPQKVAAVMAFLVLLISMVSGIKGLFFAAHTP